MKTAASQSTLSFYRELGFRIAEARRNHPEALSQEALAGRTSLTRTSIVNIEKGRQQVYLHTVLEIADALDLELTDLVPPQSDLIQHLEGRSGKGVQWILDATS